MNEILNCIKEIVLGAVSYHDDNFGNSDYQTCCS